LEFANPWFKRKASKKYSPLAIMIVPRSGRPPASATRFLDFSVLFEQLKPKFITIGRVTGHVLPSTD
jgi:hypothetical protein